jgi:hypothetical protein
MTLSGAQTTKDTVVDALKAQLQEEVRICSLDDDRVFIFIMMFWRYNRSKKIGICA